MKRNSIFGWFLAAAIFLPIVGFGSEPVHPILRGEAAPDACVLVEQRDERYVRLLQVSVKVSTPGGSGSGTICHFDPHTGWAYVISCGHLWSGNSPYEAKPKTAARITVWYKDGVRLERPEIYEAEALFWSNERGRDVSLLRFRPDWEAEYAPIASRFSPHAGMSLNSMGCDWGGEVARYEVKFKGFSGPDLTSYENSPRPGRSGGGLLDDQGSLVGICWGTSDTSSGNGTGYFTPLKAIGEVLYKNGHGWLMEMSWDARRIPVFDHDDPNASHGIHFIPMPTQRL